MANQGHCHTYNFCNNVWTFILEDVEFRPSGSLPLTVDRVKIVASDGREKEGD